ncbi:MAG: hypothetical protein ACP5UT_16870 [Bryobacteraceae bacterium]
MTTLPTYICFPVDVDDPENLQFVPLAKAGLGELKRAVQYAEADFNKAAVEMEEAKCRWQVLQATLNMLAPVMEGNPEMTVAEAVVLAGGSVSEG